MLAALKWFEVVFSYFSRLTVPAAFVTKRLSIEMYLWDGNVKPKSKDSKAQNVLCRTLGYSSTTEDQL
jgi:hypothetical protein